MKSLFQYLGQNECQMWEFGKQGRILPRRKNELRTPAAMGSCIENQWKELEKFFPRKDPRFSSPRVEVLRVGGKGNING